MTERNVEKVQEPRLLPVAKLNGREFLVDVEKRLWWQTKRGMCCGESGMGTEG